MATEKVEMKISNSDIRSRSDSCHAVAINEKLRPNDHQKILNLPVYLTVRRSAAYFPYQQNILLPMLCYQKVLEKKNIACLNTVIENRISIKLDYIPESLDLQLNHIITNLYLNYLDKNNLNKSSVLHAQFAVVFP